MSKVLINHTLPEGVAKDLVDLVPFGTKAVDSYAAVLRAQGWTLASIGEPLGISRERIRQRVARVDLEDAEEYVYTMRGLYRKSLEIPEIPERADRQPKEIVLPNDETLARLRELQPLAQQVRYNHTKYRDEAEEYVQLLWKAHTEEGVSVYRLAKLLGVLPCGIESRFVRYGLKETSGSSNSYTPVKYRTIA